MSLPTGTRLGAYEIAGLLGAGGMGEVYRARDTKLDRDVALKLLPPEFAKDAERVARFRREAKTLAGINHPHIAHVHGLEESEAGALALVMELVEGEDLAERLSRGSIAIDEALPIARQIAEALEAAHEQGIVHRDLKPANIKVTPDGTVKVLDFGLAKAIDPGAGSPSTSLRTGREPGAGGAANSPTITSPAMTMRGVILGTAGYMAPEQAKGKPVDRRADIWAFGCVLYEMLAGTRAFDGEDTTEILGAIVKTEPDWPRLPSSTPPRIVALVRRCLQKDLKKRLQHIGDARIEIDEAIAAPAPAPEAVPSRGYIPWSLVGALVTALTATLLMGWRAPEPTTFPVHVDLTTAPIFTPQQLVDLAVSPDGRHLAFMAGAQSTISVRSLETGETRRLPGTEGAVGPFWSPDGRSLGFFRGTKLMRFDLSATSPVSIANAGTFFTSADWLPDGSILFVPELGPVKRVPASGGEAVAVTSVKPGQIAHAWPRLLPDGEHYLYVASRFDAAIGFVIELYLASLQGGTERLVSSQLSAAAINFEVLPPHWFVYWFDGELRAQRLDIQQAMLVGEPVRVAAGVVNQTSTFRAAFATADSGLVAYRTDHLVRQLAWFDRTGRVLGTVGDPDGSGQMAARASPDGLRIALDRTVAGNRDVWLMDVGRENVTRLTSGPGDEGTPIWSPDATRIAFESLHAGLFNLYVRPTTGNGSEERLQIATRHQWPQDWSADGRYLLYVETANFTDGDLYALPMFGADRKPIPVATTPFSEMTGSFSPDGRWVAYDSARSGRDEVVIQSFPNPSQVIQVSRAGGRTPRWSADGTEVFFLGLDGTMMAVSIAATAAGLQPGIPAMLFQTRLGQIPGIVPFDVDRSGRFLMDIGNQAAPPIRLLLNWKPPARN